MTFPRTTMRHNYVLGTGDFYFEIDIKRARPRSIDLHDTIKRYRVCQTRCYFLRILHSTRYTFSRDEILHHKNRWSCGPDAIRDFERRVPQTDKSRDVFAGTERDRVCFVTRVWTRMGTFRCIQTSTKNTSFFY